MRVYDPLDLSSMWRLEPIPIALTITALLFYSLGTGPLRSHWFPGKVYPLRKACFFYSAMALLTLLFVSPLHTLGEYFLMSMHMFTMMAVIFIIAPLTLLGIPGWLIAPIVSQPVIRAVLRFMTRPVVNVLHFNLAFLLLHIPAILRPMMFSNDLLHYYSYFAIFASAMLMWWPVMNPVPEIIPGPGYRGKFIYLLVLLTTHNPFSSVFSFYPGIIYTWYKDTTRYFGLTPLQDQHTGGIIMGVMYMTALLVALAVVFSRWMASLNAEQQAKEAMQPPLPQT